MFDSYEFYRRTQLDTPVEWTEIYDEETCEVVGYGYAEKGD